MIRIEGVSKTFAGPGGPVEALRPVDLAIPAGSFTSIIGPSGCGKSTLLRIVAGLETASTGRIVNEGPQARPGFVFQEPVLLPWLTARENVRFPLDTSGVPRPDGDRRTDELLAMMGLSSFAEALPRTLSGGMRQRVAIARALSYDPALLLMDEPFGALDLLTRDRLNEELLRVWRDLGMTVLFVTHSIYEAAFLGQRVLMLAANPGRIREIVPVDLPPDRGLSIRETPEFVQLAAHLRQVLETC